MTRRFDGLVFCPHCRRSHTAESAFERWMRNQKALRSEEGFVRFDLDVLVHRYMTTIDKKSSRDLQLIQFVEVKCHGGELRLNQQDTLSMLSNVLRNRRTNKHQKKLGRHAKDHAPLCKVYSHILKREVDLKMYGGHLLQLSDNDPTDSKVMKWDNSRIYADELIKLLRFDLDPDNFREPDWRRRYSSFSEPTLFSPELMEVA